MTKDSNPSGSTQDTREPMTPAEFAEACRQFELRFAGGVHQTSGTRSIRGNQDAGGHEQSKHLIGMARDYLIENDGWPLMADALRYTRILGLWVKPYTWGLHLQGLPPGDVPTWWVAKYGAHRDM